MIDPDAWRPGACLDVLRARAGLYADIRSFFAARGVLEVSTPLLCSTTVTEPAITSVGAGSRWLQTSPEYAMKRLLAAGAGAIYQITPAFRAGEAGARHNPEFTLLEYYRPDFDQHALMDEVVELLGVLLPEVVVARLSFRELVQGCFGIDAWRVATADLAAAVTARAAAAGRDLDVQRLCGQDRTLVLDLAYAEAVDAAEQPAFFVFDFPPEQAALARLRDLGGGEQVAERFELVIDGVEMGNGFAELTDAQQQRSRFEHDRQRRRQWGQPLPDADERLLAALAAGLPDCAGIALGLDRLLMRMTGVSAIDEVLAFSWNRC